MPPALVTAMNTWNDWSSDPCYRPVCIDDVVASIEPVELLAAAIWLGLPDDLTITSTDELSALAGLGIGAKAVVACQLAVNLIDYVDTDTESTVLTAPTYGTFYGFEPDAHRVYISELAVSLCEDVPGSPTVSTKDYAVELYNPKSTPALLTGWQLKIGGAAGVDLSAVTIPARSAVLVIDTSDPSGFSAGATTIAVGGTAVSFSATNDIVLLDASATPVPWDHVKVPAGMPSTLASGDTADTVHISTSNRGSAVIGATDDTTVPVWGPSSSWSAPVVGMASLGVFTKTDVVTPPQIQLGVPNKALRTVGEISNVLAIGSLVDSAGNYVTMPEQWGRFAATEFDAGKINTGRIDHANENFGGLLPYLTVKDAAGTMAFSPFSDAVDNDGNGYSDDPTRDGEDNDGSGVIDDGGESAYEEYTELAVPGRININTAPWFVIAQLPWIRDRGFSTGGASYPASDEYKLAHAIVAYRDQVDLSAMPGFTAAAPNYSLGSTAFMIGNPFKSVAGLLQVTDASGTDDRYGMHYYGEDGAASPDADYTVDGVTDDLEERDLIFQRVSNLATVRSDTFTAYIMVRVGEQGPQKRVIGIFDRSNVFSPSDTPRLVALHPVPDPK